MGWLDRGRRGSDGQPAAGVFLETTSRLLLDGLTEAGGVRAYRTDPFDWEGLVVTCFAVNWLKNGCRIKEW